ncbi:MAG: DUF2933 domain-containing protein [Chloroflexi bacterium]|nr:DUF2933 domain-containing protein [Chloroflexota bacterium]
MNDIARLFKGNHTLLMVICCVVPMAFLAAVFVFNVPLGTIGTFAILMLCPLMHLFMMKGMGHGDQQAGCHGGARAEESGTKIDASLPSEGIRSPSDRQISSEETNRPAHGVPTSRESQRLAGVTKD